MSDYDGKVEARLILETAVSDEDKRKLYDLITELDTVKAELKKETGPQSSARRSLWDQIAETLRVRGYPVRSTPGGSDLIVDVARALSSVDTVKAERDEAVEILSLQRCYIRTLALRNPQSAGTKHPCTDHYPKEQWCAGCLACDMLGLNACTGEALSSPGEQEVCPECHGAKVDPCTIQEGGGIVKCGHCDGRGFTGESYVPQDEGWVRTPCPSCQPDSEQECKRFECEWCAEGRGFVYVNDGLWERCPKCSPSCQPDREGGE